MELKNLFLAACICSLAISSATAEEIEHQIYTDLTNSNVQAQGGALNIYENKTPWQIKNSIFTNNSAQGDMFSLGGAIFTTNKSVFIDGTTFDGNHVGNGDNLNLGGAIFADGSALKDGNLTITNSKFLNNYSADNNLKSTTSTKINAGGGAIATQYYKNINISNSIFSGNYATGDTDVLLGGAIAPSQMISSIGVNYGTRQNITIENTVFKDNYLSNKNVNYGGAIGSISSLDMEIKNSLFQNNSIIAGNGNRGGAIYLQLSNLNIDNTNFIENSITSGSTSYGGALFGIGCNITARNSDFINNSTTGTGGGAIFYQGNGASTVGKLQIIADRKNVEFTGNTAAGKPNAIYAGSNTQLNLNASKDNKIIFNDNIYLSSNNGTLNINNPNLYTENNSNGEIIFNANMNSVSGNVNLFGGTLRIGENGTFVNNAAKFTSNNGSIINFQNNKIDTAKITDLTLNGTTDVKIEALIDDVLYLDNFNIAKSNTGGTINITDVDMYSNVDNGIYTKDFISGAGASNIKTVLSESAKNILTQDKEYNLSISNNTLSVEQKSYNGGIKGATEYTLADSRQYQITTDEILNKNFGTMEGKEFVIKGNGNSIIGQQNEGLNLSAGQNVTLKDVSNISGFQSQNGGVINNQNGTVNITAENSNITFNGNIANGQSNAIHTEGGIINLNSSSSRSIVFNDSITSADTTSVLSINNNLSESAGTVVLNNDMSGYKGDVDLHHGTIKVGKDGSFFSVNNFNIHGCTLDFANGIIQDHSLGNLSIADKVDVMIDADLKNNSIDKISATNKIVDSGKIDITKINLLSDASENEMKINFADENLKGTVMYSGGDIAYSPIYKYDVKYDETKGDFLFNRFGGNNGSVFNSAVLASPVAAQMGGYLSQLNSYDQAFMNIDMKMLLPKELRNALKYQNKYAMTGNSPLVYSPLMSQNEKQGAWFRPYATFENVGLRGGAPRISNVMYGTFLGVDSDMQDLGNGFEGQMSVYAGYNGSHQVFDGVSMYQNGGNLGITGAIYKGNFFSALTANAGASSVEATTMYGGENFPMIMAGIASKTGYNWELAKGKFIIQPSYLMSYTWVNTFDYKNAAGVNINSDPLNAIQISPGLKLIANLKNGWQPYIGFNMVWNIMDATKFKANDVSLPQLSVKPYFEYGVGVQKLWGERFTGFFQTMLRNGGRNGVALSFGFRWTIGKSSKKAEMSIPKEIKHSAKVNLSCIKSES